MHVPPWVDQRVETGNFDRAPAKFRCTHAFSYAAIEVAGGGAACALICCDYSIHRAVTYEGIWMQLLAFRAVPWISVRK